MKCLSEVVAVDPSILARVRLNVLFKEIIMPLNDSNVTISTVFLLCFTMKNHFRPFAPVSYVGHCSVPFPSPVVQLILFSSVV